MEVVGFEPTASTLRKYGYQRFDQGLSEDFPGSGVAIPSGSLMIPPFPLDRVIQGHARTEPACRNGSVPRSDRQALVMRSESLVPAWRRSRSLANEPPPPAPDAAAAAGRTTVRQCSVRQQPVDDLSGHALHVARRAVSQSSVDDGALHLRVHDPKVCAQPS